MTVPLVAELSACTSVYGRLAPPPPVAADAGVTATAAMPAAVSDTAAAVTAKARRRSRNDGNTWRPFRVGHRCATSAGWRRGQHGADVPRNVTFPTSSRNIPTQD